MADVINERITRTEGVCGGRACIAGHRIRVMDIAILYEQMGMSADEIVSEFPTITLSDVHVALAYYFEHVDEIQEEMRQEDEFAEEFLRNNPSVIDLRLQNLVDESDD
jgi:uncharacterized protein (DUF433 family)